MVPKITPKPRSAIAQVGAFIFFLLNFFVVAGCALCAVFVAMIFGSAAFAEPPTGFLVALPLLALIFGFMKYISAIWTYNQRFVENKPVPAHYYAALPILGFALFFTISTFNMKMEGLCANANEEATRGNLGAIRSSISIYYGDMEGLYPESLSSLLEREKYMSSIPRVKIRHHSDTNEATYFPSVLSSLDSGTWGYVNNPYDANFGTVFVDCTHTDFKGTIWTSY